MSVTQVCRGVWERGDLTVGSQVGRRSFFKDEDEVLTNPATVVAEVRSPSGVVTPIVPVNEAAGTYLSTFPVFDEPGHWKWIVQGSGGINAVEQGILIVRAQLF